MLIDRLVPMMALAPERSTHQLLLVEPKGYLQFKANALFAASRMRLHKKWRSPSAGRGGTLINALHWHSKSRFGRTTGHHIGGQQNVYFQICHEFMKTLLLAYREFQLATWSDRAATSLFVVRRLRYSIFIKLKVLVKTVVQS